ncbi:hypothetical protein H6503_05540 [Candidatus Woesearchaeota archaeon]|nr:hypothetical protein [Candidatus Woesearchaeota archaeon]
MNVKRIIAIMLLFLIILLVGCSENENTDVILPDNNVNVSMSPIISYEELGELGLADNGCRTEQYKTGEFSTLSEYSFCNYTIESLDDTEVIIELKEFTDLENLNGSYQYESLHLRGYQGMISEDEYGDMSRFYVNNESDVYYYHLWIADKLQLIHVTSKGSKDAEGIIVNIGNYLLARK